MTCKELTVLCKKEILSEDTIKTIFEWHPNMIENEYNYGQEYYEDHKCIGTITCGEDSFANIFLHRDAKFSFQDSRRCIILHDFSYYVYLSNVFNCGQYNYDHDMWVNSEKVPSNVMLRFVDEAMNTLITVNN